MAPGETQSSSRPSCGRGQAERVARRAGDARRRDRTRTRWRPPSRAPDGRRRCGHDSRPSAVCDAGTRKLDHDALPIESIRCRRGYADPSSRSTRYRRACGTSPRPGPGRVRTPPSAGRRWRRWRRTPGSRPPRRRWPSPAARGSAPATRERVLAAAAELGYARPRPARGVAAPRPQRRDRRVHRRAAALRLPRPGLGAAAGRHHRGARRARRGLLLLAGDSAAGRRWSRSLRMPLDAAIFATCGLEDDPALAAAAGPRRAGGRRGGPGRRRRAADRHRRPRRHRRARQAPAPSSATAGSRPWPCRCAWTARAARSTPQRRARAHYRDVRHRIAGVEDVFGPGARRSRRRATRSRRASWPAARCSTSPPTGGPRPCSRRATSWPRACSRRRPTLGLRVPADVSRRRVRRRRPALARAGTAHHRGPAVGRRRAARPPRRRWRSSRASPPPTSCCRSRCGSARRAARRRGEQARPGEGGRVTEQRRDGREGVGLGNHPVCALRHGVPHGTTQPEKEAPWRPASEPR